MTAVGILNYGVGNIGSLVNMFKKLDVDAHVVSTPGEVAGESRLVLPGVGAYDHAMRELDARALVDPLAEFVASGRPLLGICLGMQLLVNSSEEGELPGLGYIKGVCRRFEAPPGHDLRVPHMGWNSILPIRTSGLFDDLEGEKRFYFVHSYFVDCAERINVLAETTYGGEFASMIIRDNVVGAQFHPEKSHVFGMTLLKNWSRQ
jgi:imidazole glycerol-phosphate synthase subunit HisH